MPKVSNNKVRASASTRVRKSLSFHGKPQTVSGSVLHQRPVSETAVSIMQRALSQLTTVIGSTNDHILIEACAIVRNILIDEQTLMHGTRSTSVTDGKEDNQLRRKLVESSVSANFEKVVNTLVRGCTARPSLQLSKFEGGDSTWTLISAGFGSLHIDFEYGVCWVHCFDASPDQGDASWWWWEISGMRGWWGSNNPKGIAAFVWKTWNTFQDARVHKTLSVVIAVAYMLQLDKYDLPLPIGVFVSHVHKPLALPTTIPQAVESVKRLPRYVFACSFITCSKCKCEDCSQVNVTIAASLTAKGFQIQAPTDVCNCDMVVESTVDAEAFKTKNGIAKLFRRINAAVVSKADQNFQMYGHDEEYVGMNVVRLFPLFRVRG